MQSRAARYSTIFLIWAALEAPALAYLDGATGSIILQAAIGLFATGMVYFRHFRERARSLFVRIGGKASSDADSK